MVRSVHRPKRFNINLVSTKPLFRDIFMQYALSITLVILSFFTVTLAQREAEVPEPVSDKGPAVSEKWERYSDKDHQFSVMFPRSPVRVPNKSDSCLGRAYVDHAIYVDGKIYSMRIAHKVYPSLYCGSGRAEFNTQYFFDRINSFDVEKRTLKNLIDRDAEAAEFPIEGGVRRMYNDPKNNRWFELTVTGADAKDKDVEKFLASLSIDKKLRGIEIGDGWNNTSKPLPPIDKVPEKSTGPEKEVAGGIAGMPPTPQKLGSMASGPPTVSAAPMQSVKIVLQPRPPYTEDARKQQVTGMVKLRVVFTAAGRIGGVTVIEGLEHGLTEQAVSAAKRIIFIPANKQGILVTSSKVVQYNFVLF